MNTTATVTVSEDPVGHSGIRVDVKEKEAWTLGSGGAATLALLSLAFIALSAWGIISGAIAQDNHTDTVASNIVLLVSCVALVVVTFASTGFTVISPANPEPSNSSEHTREQSVQRVSTTQSRSQPAPKSPCAFATSKPTKRKSTITPETQSTSQQSLYGK